MSTSFHYKGRLKGATFLPKLIEEVEDICNILKWKYDVYESEYKDGEFAFPPDDIDYGIVFTPQNSEPVSFIFDSEGRLYNPWLKELLKSNEEGNVKIITVKLNLNDENPQPEISEGSDKYDAEQMIYNISVKTFFEEPEGLVKLMEFLRYISDKYLTDFNLEDESQYWNTQNIENISSRIEEINSFMETFQDMIQNERIESSEDFIAFIKKMTKMLKPPTNEKDGEATQ